MRSTRSWARETVHSPGTRTCMETKRRAPACRVRMAWNFTSGPLNFESTDRSSSCSAEDQARSTRARGGPGEMEQRLGGAVHERYAGADDVRRDHQGYDRIEPQPSRQGHGADGDEDAGGSPHIRHQVVRIGFERDRSIPAPG